MKTTFVTTIALALMALFVSSAWAAITIDVAEVRDGEAYVSGKGAVYGATITWDGEAVTTVSNRRNGGFEFYSSIPPDCEGELSDGNETIPVVLSNCEPQFGPAPVPKTGQAACYDFTGGEIDCTDTGQDGDLQMGVSVDPRFSDNGDGTITDNLTGLIWLQNANCGGSMNWQAALDAVTELNMSGTMKGNNCGDTSNGGTHQNDWRLPNVRELASLIDYGQYGPALPAGHPFQNVMSNYYWSSTNYWDRPDYAWIVDFGDGYLDWGGKPYGSYSRYVSAVRGGT